MAAIKGYIKLQIPGGQANPAPPVGPALGQYWVPIQDFTSQFNEKTKDKMGIKLPVVITVFEDRTFTFVVSHMTFDQVREVAEEKMPDLNAVDTAGAMKIVDGTARAGGITTDVHEMTADEIRAKLG